MGLIVVAVLGYVLLAMTIAAGIDVAQDRRFKALSDEERVKLCRNEGCHSSRADPWLKKPTAPCNNKNHFPWCSTPLRITVACFWPLVFPVAVGTAVVLAVVLAVKLFFAKVFIPSYQHLYRGIQWAYNEAVDPKHNIREKEIEA